jgi:hypothetical protein
MIRRAVLAGVMIVAAWGEAALALTPLALWIDADGTTYLWNAREHAVDFWGYEFSSPTAGLDPAGWYSIAQSFAEDPDSVLAAFGSNAVHWQSGFLGADVIYERNVAATLGPGIRFPIGKPFRNVPLLPTDDVRYIPPFLATAFRMDIVYVPEPSTWLLGALAALSCATIRRPSLSNLAHRPRPNERRRIGTT